MPTIMANIAMFFNTVSLRLLQLLKYAVPQNQRNQGAFKASFSYFVPTITAVLSFCMLKIAMIVFFANLTGLIYKFFTAMFNYQSYKKAFESTTSIATSLHETPLLIRTVVMFVLAVVIILVIVLSCFVPNNISFDGAWTICACANILVTWFFEVVDSLVAIYGAEIQNAAKT